MIVNAVRVKDTIRQIITGCELKRLNDHSIWFTLARSKIQLDVIPAKAGIQCGAVTMELDSGSPLRCGRNDR